MTLHPHRCETCRKLKSECPVTKGYEDGTGMDVSVNRHRFSVSEICGLCCHSDAGKEREKVLEKLIADINRVSLTGFTKYTYRKWILKELRQGGE